MLRFATLSSAAQYKETNCAGAEQMTVSHSLLAPLLSQGQVEKRRPLVEREAGQDRAQPARRKAEGSQCHPAHLPGRRYDMSLSGAKHCHKGNYSLPKLTSHPRSVRISVTPEQRPLSL